jgi:CheY-like chemotaxis protein
MADAYKPKLMLVDDDDTVQDTLKPFFLGMGCDIIGLSTAEEAWAALTLGKAEVDVIILDWDLPLGMSGPQLNKKIKSHEELRKIPVVFYTANWNPKVLSGSFMDWLSAVASMRNGADGFDKDSVFDKKKKHAQPGPHPGLLLNVAQKLEETGKPVPAELAKMVNLLKAEGFDATDEVLRMGHS